MFDTHAHYDDTRFDEDRYTLIQTVHENGVKYLINAASDLNSAVESVALAQKFDFVYAAVGVHPHNAGDMSDQMLEEVKHLTENRKVVAIGEIGLDYYYDTAPRDVQKHWFARQIELAKNLKLPVIVHDRDAHEDCLDIVRNEGAKTVGGVFHCFSGSVEMAKELLKIGFYISVGGSLTFKNAKKAVEVLKTVPDDRILIETDCPYLTPEPHRGKRNDSGYIRFVAQKVAEIKGYSFEEVDDITTRNAKRLFGIDGE